MIDRFQVTRVCLLSISLLFSPHRNDAARGSDTCCEQNHLIDNMNFQT